MSRDDIHKLLGGYATGTLTPEEQQALFAAALDDQELFDALAHEQSLRDLLRDPIAKAHLLTALEEKPRAGWGLWWRPAVVGFAMTAVALLTVTVVRQGVLKPEAPTVAVVSPKSEVAQPAAAAPPSASTEAGPLKAAAPARAEDELLAKDQEVGAEKKRAANELRQEKDTAAAPRGDRPSVAISAGAQPLTLEPPAPQAAPPAPPPAPKEKVEVTATPDLRAAPATASVDAGRARPGARALFLSQAPQAEMMKFNAVAEQRFAQQSQAPPAGQQQQAPSQGQQSQSLGGVADGKLIAPLPQQPGVRYRFTGAVLRLETNDTGFLSAMARGSAGTWRVVLAVPARPMQPFAAEALRPDEKEVFVSFSRLGQMLKSGPSPPQPGDDPSTNLVERDGDLTYVANPLLGQASRDLTFTIRLP